MKLGGILGLALALGISACTSASDGPVDPGPPDPELVATVVLTPHLAELEVGVTYQFGAVTLDSAGGVLQGRSTAWASSEPGVATVDSNGLAIALTPGLTSITATSEGITDSTSKSIRSVNSS